MAHVGVRLVVVVGRAARIAKRILAVKLDVVGRPANGDSLGAAMADMERLAASLPTGIGYGWGDAAREETVAARQTPLLIGRPALAVFMARAALYESWTMPLSVPTVAPLDRHARIGDALARLRRRRGRARRRVGVRARISGRDAD